MPTFISAKEHSRHDPAIITGRNLIAGQWRSPNGTGFESLKP